ncbi:hypothetical protein AXY_01970 [Amphibacillus xylanus NBRC 15112]|uniref:Uncharacterized protein n=1 Tax=Amphibacillus xylanus (strain ATCC 51415 / DSM 6626 / JCM 7361 / LMG 17667 / NBRC 15112 / Ep01) TaxID=698758 RepID=K0IV80_AMPXN|nr:hypothetical protein [Amphibacillus xylanus]BAM46329.1 hypothetical protein AXY_01970 [Amphibacillus xylanus NBRC 15112]
MKDDIQFLKDLQQELTTQENDGQAAPRFWAIMDYKWEVTEEGHHDRVSLYSPETCGYKTVDEYIDEILNGDRRDEFNDEQIEELQDIKDYFLSDLEEWIKENDLREYHLIYETEVSFIAYNTCFFTKAEAKSHLKNNRHHYSRKAHTFAMTAWRAPKMERLMKILESFDWDSVNWLIEQAERVRELEDELIEQKECFEELQNNHTRVCNQNKRYREVIKKAIDDLENECLWDALVSLKALEGEE